MKRESLPGNGRRWPWLVVLLLATAARAGADDARLVRRLGPELARQVEDIVQSARADSLPTVPLVATALEGASKHVARPRIVAALWRHLESLREARAALGPGVGDPVLVAAAAALRAGIARDSLIHLQAARPGPSLLVPLVVLSDVVARRVPSDAGSGVIIALVRAGASDAELMNVRAGIDADIGNGVAPLESAGVRAHALLRTLRASGAPPEPLRVPVPVRSPVHTPGERP